MGADAHISSSRESAKVETIDNADTRDKKFHDIERDSLQYRTRSRAEYDRVYVRHSGEGSSSLEAGRGLFVPYLPTYQTSNLNCLCTDHLDSKLKSDFDQSP